MIKFTWEAIVSWAFVSWEVFNHGFTFSACDWSVCIFYFFLVQSIDTYLSKNLSILFRLSILLAYICSLCLCSLMSDSLRFHRLYLCPSDFKGKNTRVSCHFFLQGIFLIQGSNPHLLYLLHWQADYLPSVPLEKPTIFHDSLLWSLVFLWSQL